MKNTIPSITRKPKGPIVVEGEVQLLNENGNNIEHRTKFTLCGCGKSQNMPFCDGTHND